MRILLFLTLCICFITTNAVQNSYSQTSEVEITAEDLRDAITTGRVTVKQATEIRGTPYLFEDYHNGVVTLEDGRITEEILMRFNAYENSVEYRDDNLVLAIDGNDIREFVLHTPSGEQFFTRGYDARRLDPADFVHVLADGKVKFLINYSKNYQENLPTYGSATQIDEYIDDVNYYIKDESGDINRLRSLSERRVMRNINSHTDLVEQFVEENNTDFSNAQDVANMLHYYNSLLEEE